MKVSYFETGRYQAPPSLPAEWPMAPGAYDPEQGVRVYRDMVERIAYVERLGFDWVSLSEHHYSPRILTPAPAVAAAFIAAKVHKIKIALLGPIVSHSNPIRVAEELAMLDTLSGGRLIAGLLRGTSNEALTYDLNPQESRERTDEGMELILKAWTEPRPFGWQGRHFRYRTVSVWPRPLQQPHPPTYALGTSREAGAFAARNRIGLGVSYGPFDVMGKATGYYRAECARHGWTPDSEHIVFRANILLAETDEAAHRALEAYPARAAFSLGAKVADALLELDTRNIAGEVRPASINRALPINFIGGPDAVVEQMERCHRETGAGILDLGFNTPGSTDPADLMGALDLFARKVLPRIRDIKVLPRIRDI
jgi:alkanesulfonate monooxygenase SsuD/methylene tetrahydromethanopterin reductase-like flavin-dependent oxidoreductase (luciferase family)